MKRTIVVVILAIGALGLLASVALRSQSVPVAAHIAHNTIRTEVVRIADELATLRSSLESAWQNIRAPGEGARAIAANIAADTEDLREPVMQLPGNAGQRNRIVTGYEGFAATVAEAGVLTDELLDALDDYAENVSYLRQTGPQILQQMRDIRLDTAATSTFQLIAGTLDFATPGANVDDSRLRELLVKVEQDPGLNANMPGYVESLTSKATAILNNKGEIQERLVELAEIPVAANAANLSAAATDAYTGAVAATDRARLMLAIYAVVLLLSVGFIAYRLKGSYEEVNRANTELAGLNESLENRVAERTHELEGTLADLKESQVQLVQAEKMSSLGQLVAGISHEINTPLLYLANNAILLQERVESFSQFLKRSIHAFSIKPEDFEDRSEYQAQFIAALRDLKITIRDHELEADIAEAQNLVTDSIDGLADLTEMAQSLKDFSRLDRAAVSSFDINGGLDKTLLIAKNIIKHKAEVTKHYGKLPEIQCSPSQVNQVFLNLVTNAAQAIEGQGEIVITTKLENAEHVAVTISDNGCGISEENLAKIRDPFFTTKEVGTGTGLGLSIVDEIIRSHGGELRVESEIGKGSAFTVVLPVKGAERGSPRPDAPTENSQPAAPEATMEEEAALAEAV